MKNTTRGILFLDIGRREGFTLRYGYRYANASSFMPGNPSTGMAQRFASTLKKLTLRLRSGSTVSVRVASRREAELLTLTKVLALT